MPTRLSWLPADIIYLLTLRLSWRDVYECYLHLPEFRRFDDVDHQVWKELYRRDLSTYPLNTEPKPWAEHPNYRDQFFWAWVMLDQPTPLHSKLQFLVDIGYDVALRELYTKCEHDRIYGMMVIAAKCGYLKIVEDLCKLIDPVNGSLRLSPTERSCSLGIALHRSIRHNHPDVMEYLLPLIPSHYHLALLKEAMKGGHYSLFERFLAGNMPLTHMPTEVLHELMTAAGIGGNTRIVEHMLGIRQTVDMYTAGLLGAIEGDHLDLMDTMHERGAVIDISAYTAANRSWSPDERVYLWLFERTDIAPTPCLHDLLFMGYSELFEWLLDYCLDRWPESFSLAIWDQFLVECYKTKLLEFILHHPAANFSPGAIRGRLFYWAGMHTPTYTKMFLVLFHDNIRNHPTEGWSDHNVIRELLIRLPHGEAQTNLRVGEVDRPPLVDVKANTIDPLMVFTTVLNSVEWTQDELGMILRETLARHSRSHTDAVLGLMKTDDGVVGGKAG